MRTVKTDSESEQRRAGISEGDIAERLKRAGLEDVVGGGLEVEVEYSDFEEFWEPFTHGVGPAGQAFAALGEEDRQAVGEAIRGELPEGPFTLGARSWYATAVV
jgi:hypothetical protein